MTICGPKVPDSVIFRRFFALLGIFGSITRYLAMYQKQIVRAPDDHGARTICF
jgi:hypothetical protein